MAEYVLILIGLVVTVKLARWAFLPARYLPGNRARTLRLDRLDPDTIAFVVISPNDPPAMAAHAEYCRTKDIPFLYDPSQQVTRLSGDEMREGFRGAAILIVNDYEFGILQNKTGLSKEEFERQVPVLGIGLGMQQLNAALGGSLYLHLAEEQPRALPHYDPTGGPHHHAVLLEPNTRIDEIYGGGEIRVNQSCVVAFCGPSRYLVRQDDCHDTAMTTLPETKLDALLARHAMVEAELTRERNHQ